MNKCYLSIVLALLAAVLLTGCGDAPDLETVETEPAANHTVAATDAPVEDAEDDVVYEGDASSYYIDKVYAEQIGRYHTALSEKWDEGKYLENGMSALPHHYYEGNPLDNVGFGFADLDNDGHWELIIGAILGAEEDPAVFEIWTLVNGEPAMLVQGDSENRYVLQYVEEDRVWYVVNECAKSTANHGTYYLMLSEGKFQVVQGIVFDAAANEKNPWFMTYDLDWDISNDEPIDEATANAILESNRDLYTALEYFPYIFY